MSATTGFRAVREELALELALVLGDEVENIYPHVPPSIVPPCAIVWPAQDWAEPAGPASTFRARYELAIVGDRDLTQRAGWMDDAATMLARNVPGVVDLSGVRFTTFGADDYPTVVATVERVVCLEDDPAAFQACPPYPSTGEYPSPQLHPCTNPVPYPDLDRYPALDVWPQHEEYPPR